MVAFAFCLALLFLVVVDVEGFLQAKSTSNWNAWHAGTSATEESEQISSIVRRESLLKVRLARKNDDDDDEIEEGNDIGLDAREAGGMDRRRALTATGLAMMSLWLGDTFGNDNVASKWAASAAEEASAASGSKTILITGCNSGIGLEGARILAKQGEKIILACRTKQKAEDTAKLILAESPNADLIPAECDLTSLESVKKFASTVPSGIDVVCYNAGIALNTAGDIERTADGFEKTIGTNHLGHFYLHHLLEPKIATKNKDAGKVVITASSVHDPESPGGKQGVPATLGNLEGFSRDGSSFEMVDGNPYNGDKAYKDSKLCNILFCRELTRRLAQKNIVVNAFSPGLITSGGFFRYQNPVFSSIFNVAATNLLKVAETPEYGGAALAYMTTIDRTKGEFYDSPPGTSNKYTSDQNNYKGAFGKEFKVAQVSKEGQDEQKGLELWKLSEKLVGI
jgi:protochlorophyllide reductase